MRRICGCLGVALMTLLVMGSTITVSATEVTTTPITNERKREIVTDAVDKYAELILSLSPPEVALEIGLTDTGEQDFAVEIVTDIETYQVDFSLETAESELNLAIDNNEEWQPEPVAMGDYVVPDYLSWLDSQSRTNQIGLLCTQEIWARFIKSPAESYYTDDLNYNEEEKAFFASCVEKAQQYLAPDMVLSALVFSGSGIKAHNQNMGESETFVYGDTITFSAKAESVSIPTSAKLFVDDKNLMAEPEDMLQGFNEYINDYMSRFSMAAYPGTDFWTATYIGSYNTLNKIMKIGENVVRVECTDGDGNVQKPKTTGVVTLEPKPLRNFEVVSTDTSAQKNYDGTNTFTGVLLSTTDVIGGDQVTVYADGTVENAEPGTWNFIPTSFHELGGADAEYYVVSEPEVSGTVAITGTVPTPTPTPTPSPAPTAAPTQSPTPEPPKPEPSPATDGKSPNTGDEGNFLPAVLTVLSVGGIAFVLLRRVKAKIVK